MKVLNIPFRHFFTGSRRTRGEKGAYTLEYLPGGNTNGAVYLRGFLSSAELRQIADIMDQLDEATMIRRKPSGEGNRYPQSGIDF